MGYSNGCDGTVFAYEEHFCENLQKLEDAGELRWQKEKAKWDAERSGEE
jgi:hypothetical protein